eukprot:jgi/Bigna1/140811/aug1.58_g15519
MASAPSLGLRLRVLFEDGWDYGKIVKVGDKKKEEEGKDDSWPIAVQFDGEGPEEKEEYIYPDKDILLERDEEFFLEALDKGDTKLMRALLKVCGHMVNSRGEMGAITVSQQACLQHSGEALEILCEHGLNPNEVFGEEAESLLHMAVTHQKVPSIATLINHSADVSLSDGRGRVPLHLAAHTGNVDVLNALLRCHKDTLNFFQLLMGETSEVSNDSKLLIDLDIKIDPPIKEGEIEMTDAKGKPKSAREIKQERDKKKNKGNRRTALHIAAMLGHSKFVERSPKYIFYINNA